MADKVIDHEYTSNMVCPYCGYEDIDSWEVYPSEEYLGLIDCKSCDKPFYAHRSITIDYRTEKANYGTCKCCGEEDVPLESLRSSIGSYEDLCLSCGYKEKHRLEIAYIEGL